MTGFPNISAIAQRWAGASQSVIQAIQGASSATGVSFDYLMNKAQQESSFDPNAKASTSSATGLFQFIDSTWLSAVKNYGSQFGLGDLSAKISVDGSGHASVADPVAKQQILQLRNDPTIASDLDAAMTKDNASYLQSSLGGKVGQTDLYLAHFLGLSGADKFLKAKQADPTTAAADLMPSAASANQHVFYNKDGSKKSLDDVYQFFAGKMDGGSTVQAPVVTGTVTAQAAGRSPNALALAKTTTAPQAMAYLPSINGMLGSDMSAMTHTTELGQRQFIDTLLSGIQSFGSKDTLNSLKGSTLSPYTAFVLSKLNSPDEKDHSVQNQNQRQDHLFAA